MGTDPRAPPGGTDRKWRAVTRRSEKREEESGNNAKRFRLQHVSCSRSALFPSPPLDGSMSPEP